MKHKIIFHKILLVIISCLVFVGTVVTHKAIDDVSTAYKWRNMIDNTLNLNDEINFLLEKVFLEADYDLAMRYAAELDNELDELKSDKIISFEKLTANEKLLNEAQSKFREKRKLVDEFNSVSVMAKLAYDEMMLKFEQMEGFYFNEMMPQILIFRYDITTDLKAPKKLLDGYLSSPSIAKSDKEFLLGVEKLLDYYIKVQQIFDKIVNLRLYQTLYELQERNGRYVEKVMSNLNKMTILISTIFGFCVILIYLSYKKAKKNIKLLNRFEQAVDNSFNSVVFTNLDRKVEYANRVFEQNFGYNLQDIRGENINLLKSYLHPKEFYDNMIRSIESNETWRADNLISRAKDGSLVYEQVVFTPLFDERGERDGYMSIKFNKTKETLITKELEDKNKQLQNEAFVDKLTGLGSYFALTQRLNEYPSGKIIYININNFMDFRFFYKTKTVELIIASFAKTLKLCMDTYKMQADIYRVQFDEFCIWHNGNDIERDLDKFIGYFKENNLYVTIDGKKEFIPNIKITIGVSLMQDTPQTNRLTQAMLAHYEARQKDEAIEHYTQNSHIEQQYYQNQMMSRTIEYALFNDTVIVECQGIFDVSSQEQKVKYYEVLVRLIDESGKIRYPGEFLDISKKISLYNDITKKVIEHTFRLVERFTNLSFSMNLSSSDIANESIRDLIESKLKVCSNPTHVYFEILESEGVDDYKIVNDFINKIRGYQCKIAIDDFGSGYSNYYRILELDIDTIKIDGSIIKKLPFDKNARSLLSTIIGFAEQQGYDIVAEFVSSPEILEEVKKFDIKYVQGFLLGKPTLPDNIK